MSAPTKHNGAKSRSENIGQKQKTGPVTLRGQRSLLTDPAFHLKGIYMNNINEMTAMLDSYVSFVRGAIPDPIEQIKFKYFLNEICQNIKKENKELKLNVIRDIKSSGRPLQLRRCFVNIIENAIRYSQKIIGDRHRAGHPCEGMALHQGNVGQDL